MIDYQLHNNNSSYWCDIESSDTECYTASHDIISLQNVMECENKILVAQIQYRSYGDEEEHPCNYWKHHIDKEFVITVFYNDAYCIYSDKTVYHNAKLVSVSDGIWKQGDFSKHAIELHFAVDEENIEYERKKIGTTKA